MPVSTDILGRLRAARCRLDDGCNVHCDDGAARYIDERGFVLLMPIKGVPLPSLSAANGTAVWGEDFQCTDQAWAWKETLPGRKLCAYLKLIRGRGTFVSWRLYPAFFAAYGPAGDFAEEYADGRLGRGERDLTLLVAERGSVDSRELWRLAKSLFAGKRSRYLAALDRLQARFILTVAGGSVEGWSRHTWDLVERQVPPGLLVAPPTPREARARILRQTLENCGAAPRQLLAGLLRFTPTEMEAARQDLAAVGGAVTVDAAGQGGSWIAAPGMKAGGEPGCG